MGPLGFLFHALLLVCAGSGVLFAQAPPAASTAPAPSEISVEKRALEKLSTENQLERERLARRLLAVNAEKEEIALRRALLQEKLGLDLAELEARHKKAAVENAVADEKGKRDLFELRQQREKLRLEMEIEKEKLQSQMARYDLEKSEIDLEMRRIDLKGRKLKFQAEEFESRTAEIKTDLELRVKREEWKSEANREPDYLKEPFADGRLTLSDRRIPLNGPIVRGMADYVTERVHFFNNKSGELPIFIIIDRSPGGSVMEGYRIVKAMQASKAPVYVVVRSFAASMAAVIATLAPRSFAYPNAVILHHQMSSFMFGNMTQMKEQLETAKEWYRRLGNSVAGKMGLSLDDFTRQMYAHNSDGDWEEFADKARSLKWVDEIVHEIRETGIIKHPDKAPKPAPIVELKEETDSKGERFMRLPRLEPFDLYYLYNRDGYYR